MIHMAKLIVFDPIGLHARPAGQIVQLVNESNLVVRIGKPGQELVSANSPLRVMALKAKNLDELILEIESESEPEAKSLADAIQRALRASQ